MALQLPTTLMRQAQGALARASELTEDQKSALFAVLDKFEPNAGAVTPDEIEDLAHAARCDTRVVRDSFLLTYVLAQESAPTDGEIVEGLAPKAESGAVTAFLEVFRPVAMRLSEKLDFYQSVEWAMPSFRDVFVANDLRAVPIADGETLKLVPVSVIKLVLDEGNPIFFQCLPGGMSKLIDALVDATETLQKLQSISDSRSG